MKVKFVFILVLFLLCAFTSVHAKKMHYPSGSSMVTVTDKIQKHFDRDKDGALNRYEYSLYRTQQQFKYPLVSKKKQKPYDFNGDYMLEPFEMSSYLRDKKAGKLKKSQKGLVTGKTKKSKKTKNYNIY